MHKIAKSEIDLQHAEAFAFCDPSLGVSDYSAIVTVLKHDDSWIVFHCDMSRAPHSKLIELQSFFNYKQVGIEANSLGKAKSDREPCSFELVLRERQRAAKARPVSKKKIVMIYSCGAQTPHLLTCRSSTRATAAPFNEKIVRQYRNLNGRSDSFITHIPHFALINEISF